MIVPTLGCVLWYKPGLNEQLPTNKDGRCSATICCVHSDRLVNVSVYDSLGNHHARVSVPLLQSGDSPPASGGYCEWPTIGPSPGAAPRHLQEAMPQKKGSPADEQFEREKKGSPIDER